MRNNVLVVTPTMGRSPFLDQTVHSVRRLPARLGWRHIIVSPAVEVADLQRRYPRSTSIAEHSRGMYGAINDGARCTDQWNWLTYINDDDYLLDDVARTARRLTASFETSSPLIVYSRVLFVKASGDPICEFPIERDPRRLLDYYRIACNPIATHGTFINRAAFELLGGFDDSFRYAGDMDFFVRALHQKVRFVYAPFMGAAFRLHGQNLTSHVDAFAAEEERVRASLRRPPSALRARLLRLAFVIENWQSYCQRVATIRGVSISRHIAKLNRVHN